MGAKKTQIILICSALILFVLLFISPKIESKDSVESRTNVAVSASTLKPLDQSGFEVYVNMAIKQLEPVQKKIFDRLKNSGLTDSTVLFWNRLKRPDIASVFEEENAVRTNKHEAWMKAGNRYYSSVQFMQDETEIPALYQRGMYCFKKAIALSPADIDGKILLASCYIEGTEDPMQGINMLKAIEKTDSSNLKLQLAFAFFSVKSGQLDRAVIRFNKALQIDSNYTEAYLHLADVYEKLGEKDKTILMLEKYTARSNDPGTKAEIDKYIQQLKLNN